VKNFKKDVIVCAKFVPAIGVGGSNARAVAVLVGKMGESSKFYGKNFWQNAEEWPQPVAVLGLRSRFDPRISIA